MLKLRRATVVGVEPLEVELEAAGERRRAWADEGLVGPCELGDELVVNVAAVDLGLGSGGFDIVHVNLTRGLEAANPPPGVHVMKLNYSSLQHAVDPVEAPVGSPIRPERRMPVAVVPLHGHLAPLVWACDRARPGARVGFIQAAGGGITGALSRDVAGLSERGLLCGVVTANPSFGGQSEAISLTGALHAAAEELGWDAAIVGPGPGILGSETRYGHGGMAALDACHAALALGLPTLVSPRMSSGDPRPRHQGLSHHSRSILELVLAPVEVAVPAGLSDLWPEAGPQGAGETLAELTEAGHRVCEAEADLDAYSRESGLPQRTMGRGLDADRLFFAAPLAAGTRLAQLLAA